jgi:hypothetical protein
VTVHDNLAWLFSTGVSVGECPEAAHRSGKWRAPAPDPG